MIERICPKCRVPMNGEKCIKPNCKCNGTGKITYSIDNEKCKRCTECVSHFNAGCYMRKVLGIKRT